PRERPVSRSVMTAADTTTPWRANAARRLSLEVVKDRPPTNSFTDMGALLLNPHSLWRAQDVSCDPSAGRPLVMSIPSPPRVRGGPGPHRIKPSGPHWSWP